jgi:hypothetical protein
MMHPVYRQLANLLDRTEREISDTDRKLHSDIADHERTRLVLRHSELTRDCWCLQRALNLAEDL